jgi:4-hydroxy-tetrahydrodipicolinate synthase
MQGSFVGNLGLLVTPFDETEALDLASFSNLIDFAVSGGADGLIPLGTTGEFFSLTAEEKRQVIDRCVDQTRGGVPVWVGVGYSGTQIAVDLARYAADRGAHGILVPPPYYYPLSDNAMYLHFATIAKAVNVEVMLYDGGGGTEIPVGLIDRLNRELPHVSKVKVSILRASKIAALRSALGDRVQLLCGDEVMLMPALAHGAVGMATASGIILPDICSDICRYYSDGKVDHAHQLYVRYLAPWTIASGITKSEFVRCFKEVLAAKGVIASPTTRLPLDQLDAARRADLIETATEIGMLPRAPRRSQLKHKEGTRRPTSDVGIGQGTMASQGV